MPIEKDLSHILPAEELFPDWLVNVRVATTADMLDILTKIREGVPTSNSPTEKEENE